MRKNHDFLPQHPTRQKRRLISSTSYVTQNHKLPCTAEGWTVCTTVRRANSHQLLAVCSDVCGTFANTYSQSRELIMWSKTSKLLSLSETRTDNNTTVRNFRAATAEVNESRTSRTSLPHVQTSKKFHQS